MGSDIVLIVGQERFLTGLEDKIAKLALLERFNRQLLRPVAFFVLQASMKTCLPPLRAKRVQLARLL
jgi:hypothetical protein